MIGTLAEKTANGGQLSTISGETLSKLVLNGDLSSLSQQQKVEYYVYRCTAAGLDPATKPFDLLTLQGKQVLYATKECSNQISNRDHLSVEVVSDGMVGDLFRVVARAISPDGRHTDDMGAVSVKGLSGDALCNAMMKATTKAKRRAILAHAGLGMMDESEVETVKTVPLVVVDNDPPKEPTKQEFPPSRAPQGVTPTPGESFKKQSAPDNGDTPSFASIQEATAQGYVPVVVKRILKRTGETKGKAWTRYGVEVIWEGAPEPIFLNTFSESFAAYARRHEGIAAYVKWEEKQSGTYLNRDLTAVAEVSNG